MSRSCAVSTFCETLPMDFFSSPKRLVPGIRSRRMSTFHLSPISRSVVSTGQAGNSFVVCTKPPPHFPLGCKRKTAPCFLFFPFRKEYTTRPRRLPRANLLGFSQNPKKIFLRAVLQKIPQTFAFVSSG